jgi:hypothetical protein
MRKFQIRNMDFEYAVWQMLYLGKEKVYFFCLLFFFVFFFFCFFFC